VVGRRAPEKGMTLVELMVTMIIASIVAASTFMFFAGQQRVYETQTKMLNVQQNAWAAMEVLTRFVRAAGSGMYGCVRPVGGIVPSLPLARSPDANPDDSDDPPVLLPTDAGAHKLSLRPNAGLRAYNGAGGMQRIPPLWIVDQVVADTSTTGIVAGTDVITVAFGNRSSGTNFDSPLSGTVPDTNAGTNIPLPVGNAAMFQPGEFIVLVGQPGMGVPSTTFGFASDIGCTFLQITSLTNGTPSLLYHAAGATACPPPPAGNCAGSMWNPSIGVGAMVPGVGGYQAPPTGSSTGVRNFGEFWWVQFAIRMTDKNGTRLASQTHNVPVLTMERLDGSPTTPPGPQVLAEGIENLQVAFACDLNADGILTEGPNKAQDEWMLNDPNDVIAPNKAAKCNQPSGVRLTLVARSLTEDNGIDAKGLLNGSPSVENNVRTCCTTSTQTCCDQFRRRVLSTTVYPRN